MLRSTRTALTAALVGALIVPLAAPVGALEGRAATAAPARATTAPAAATVDRISGLDRYATAVAASQRAFPTGSTPRTVYLAAGLTYPDAIAAGPVAAADDAGLLLTESTRLTPSVETELRRLDPDTIVIVGGTGVIAPAVQSSASAIATTVRIGGVDRYDTAEQLVRSVFAPTGATHVFLATGTSYPDALTAGPAAGSRGAPVVLVDGSRPALTPAALTLLDDLGVETVTVVGGTGVISTGIAAQLAALLGPGAVARAAGADRYATAIEVNRQSFGAPTGGVFVASGFGFADALSISVYAAQHGRPLYLSVPYCAPDAVRTTLSSSAVTSLTLVGGAGSIGASVGRLDPCLSLSTPSSPWVLANKKRPLPTSYIPASLRLPAVPSANSQPMRSDAATALEQMVAAARSAGAGQLGLLSGYRSAATQASIYTRTVETNGQAYADSYVARPGYSEHQTGLAADLYPIGTPGCSTTTCLGGTPQGAWLAANAWRYGFILRYEVGQTAVTGYSPEIWHYRWVGTSLAADYRASGAKSLEAFLGAPPAPGY